MPSPPRLYGFYDFYNVGRNRFPGEYQAITNDSIYTFRQKNYYDGHNMIQRAAMTLVGHYFYKVGGLPVWARSDGHHVYYYRGREGLVQPIQEEFKSRIYWN
jgi:hypothetical protein